MAKRNMRRRMVAALLATAALLIAIGAGVVVSRTPVGGQLILGTDYGSPDAEIFVGDKRVGTGRVEIPWAEIMGWNGGRPLGVVLPPDAAPVACVAWDRTFLAEATAERLAGPGATLLAVSPGSPMWLRNGRNEAAKGELLFRRADGSLDQVFCLDTQLTDLFGRSYRVLVPIRVRDGSGSATYFTTHNGGGGLGRFANVLHRFTTDWNFESTAAPTEVAAEQRDQPLWSPAS